MTARLVVTGANGYLGGYLLRWAARRGHDVQGVVRAPVPWLAAEPQRVASLLPDAEAAVDGADVVVHLAAPNETAFRTNPEEAFEQTVSLSRNVARACSGTGVRRMVYVSTVHVYGSAMAPGALITEATVPSPLGGYGESRLASESVIRKEAVGVEVVILRLTNGVGCPVSASVPRWTLVANDLCRQAAETGRITLAQPSQWRDFIPLGAVSRVILAASDPTHDERIPPEIYNLSAGRSITILELARLVMAQAEDMGLRVSIDAPVEKATWPYQVDNSKIAQTGLLPDDLTLSGELRETLELCVGAAKGSEGFASQGT